MEARPPATEAVATAAAAGFQPRPCSGCEERGGAHPDRTWFPEPRPEAVASTWRDFCVKQFWLSWNSNSPRYLPPEC